MIDKITKIINEHNYILTTKDIIEFIDEPTTLVLQTLTKMHKNGIISKMSGDYNDPGQYAATLCFWWGKINQTLVKNDQI